MIIDISGCCSCDGQYISASQSIDTTKESVSGTYSFNTYSIDDLSGDYGDEIRRVLSNSTDSRKILYAGTLDGKPLFVNLII